MGLKHSFKYSRRKDAKDFIGFGLSEDVKNWINQLKYFLYGVRRYHDDRRVMGTLQIDLASAIKITQDFRQQARAELDKLIGKEEPTEKQRKDNRFIDGWARAEGACTIVNNALFDILDGVAWRFYNYDRCFLVAAAKEASNSIIQLDKGFINELEYWINLTHNNDYENILFNGITRSFNIGDFSVMLDNDEIKIWELKTNVSPHGKAMRERRERQNQKMDNFAKLFNERVGFSEGVDVQIIDSEIDLMSDLPKLCGLIDERLESDGYFSGPINEYCVAVVLNVSKKFKEDDVSAILEAGTSTMNNEWGKDDKRVNQVIPTFFKKTPNVAPISLWPLCENSVISILTQRYVCVLWYNLSEIERIIERSGWKVIYSAFQSGGLDIKKSPIHIRKGSLNIDIPWTGVNRITSELMRPETILLQINEEIYKKGPCDERNILLGFKQEPTLWW